MEIIESKTLDNQRRYTAGVPCGVCSRLIEAVTHNGTVEAVRFSGGCAGNTQGLERPVAGMAVDDVVRRLAGIDCAGKGTSCPDQLASLLRQASSDASPENQHTNL